MMAVDKRFDFKAQDRIPDATKPLEFISSGTPTKEPVYWHLSTSWFTNRGELVSRDPAGLQMQWFPLPLNGLVGPNAKCKLTIHRGQFTWSGMLDIGQTVSFLADSWNLKLVFPGNGPSLRFQIDETFTAHCAPSVAGEGGQGSSRVLLSEGRSNLGGSVTDDPRAIPWGAKVLHYTAASASAVVTATPSTQIDIGYFDGITLQRIATQRPSIAIPAPIRIPGPAEGTLVPLWPNAVRVRNLSATSCNYSLIWEIAVP